jgi:non-specific serine/threonine protein kinase
MLLAGRAPDLYPAAYARLMAAMAAFSMDDRTLAREYATQSVELFRKIGDQRGAGYARCVVADCLSGEGVPAEALPILRACFGVFEGLVDRWGLLISTGSAALTYAARGDWRKAAFALGVVDSLGERIGGRLFPVMQAAISATAALTTKELGSSADPPCEAGRAVGRGDSIAAALGLAQESAPAVAQQELTLTKREHEVTDLMAGGLTNRQIAERLFIAQRTVDTHVGHILAKLGCSNRSQVAVLINSCRPPAAPP